MYLDYITLSWEQKKKYITIGIFSLLFIILWIVAVLYVFNKPITQQTPVVTVEDPNKIEETTSVNGVTSTVKPKEEIKTSYVTNNDQIKSEIFTSDSEIKENYDLKQKIEVSNEQHFGDIIVLFLQIWQLSKKDIENLNQYLLKIKQSPLTKNCEQIRCSLKEKMDIYDELSQYNKKLVEQKAQVNTTLSNILSFSNLYDLKLNLDTTNKCSDLDVISWYLLKLRLSWEKLINEKRFLDFKEKYLDDSQMINYKLKIDSIVSEKNIEMNFSDLQQIKQSKVETYTITIWADKMTLQYYNYNSQLFEKWEIDKLSSQEENKLVKMTGSQNFVYFFGAEYIITNEGKVKVYVPKLVLLKDKGILDTLTYIYLASIKDNCNSREYLSFTNYETDITNRNLISNLISSYKTQKTLLTTWQVDISKANEISLQIKDVELLLSEVFIY